MYEFYRVAACVPEVKPGDVDYNVSKILEKLEEAYELSPAVIAFPELSVTGYSCQDLFFQKPLIEATKKGLSTILAATFERNEVIIVGYVSFSFDVIGTFINKFIFSNIKNIIIIFSRI